MNKYVIITMNITDIGGGPIYVNNKCKFLKNRGWAPYVFSSLKRRIMISNLEQYRDLIKPALMYPPYYYTKREINRNIDFILKAIAYNKEDNLIVETNGTYSGEWGELLAKRTNGRHILLNLQERHDYGEDSIKFLRFKLCRKELSGIVKESVSLMVKDSAIPFRVDMVFQAFCNNVVDDCEDKYSSMFVKKSSLTFGSIGRLTKPYIIPVLEQVKAYCNNYPTESFNLLLIGGAPDTRIDEIKKCVSEQKNIQLVITGDMYPISRELLKSVDIFISASGSATVSFNEKRPTIKVARDGQPLGIMGYSYEEGNMYNVLDSETVLDEIKALVSNTVAVKYPENVTEEYNKKMYAEFDTQLQRVVESDYPKDYYDIFKIKHRLNSTKGIFYFLLGKALGGEGMQWVLEKLRHLNISRRGGRKSFRFRLLCVDWLVKSGFLSHKTLIDVNNLSIINVDDFEAKLNVSSSNNLIELTSREEKLYFRPIREQLPRKKVFQRIVEEYIAITGRVCVTELLNGTDEKKFLKMGVSNDAHSNVFQYFQSHDRELIGIPDSISLSNQELDLFINYAWSEIQAYKHICGAGEYNTFNYNRSRSQYEIYSLFNETNLICPVSLCKLKFPNGYTVIGSVMPDAGGVNTVKMNVNERKRILSERLKSKLDVLNVLDVLCRETDHRPGNYSVILDDCGKAFSIKAFDNDSVLAFFPSLSIKKSRTGVSSLIGRGGCFNRETIDENFKKTFINITEKQLDTAVKPYLNAIQRYALKRRFSKLKALLCKDISSLKEGKSYGGDVKTYCDLMLNWDERQNNISYEIEEQIPMIQVI